MSIHKRQTKKGVVYDVRWREGDRNLSSVVHSRRDAVAFEATTQRRLRMGAHAVAEPSAMRLEDFMLEWFRTGAAVWEGTTTRSRGQLMDRWVTPYLGDMKLRDIGRQVIRAYRSEIMDAGSPPTNTNNVLRCLSACLGTAARDGLIPANPCTGLGQIRQVRPRRHALDQDSVEAFVKAMPTDRDRLITALLANGLRPAEIVALRWRDLDDGMIDVYESVQERELRPVKNDSPRIIPHEALLNRIIGGGNTPENPADLVAPGVKGGYLNWKMWTRKVWGNAREDAQVSAVPYDLRHTYASTLIMRGEDLLTVAYKMGHSPRVTLSHYAHLIGKVQRPDAQTYRRASAAAHAS